MYKVSKQASLVALAVYTLVALAVYAEDKPQPIRVVVPKSGAEYNQETGKWKIDRGIEPEDVMTQLLKEAVGLSQQLAACQEQLKPKPKDKKDDHGKKTKSEDTTKTK